MKRAWTVFAAFLWSFFLGPAGYAMETPASPASETLLRDTFYVMHQAKLKQELYDVEGFLLITHPAPEWNSSFSVVTGFKGDVVTSHVMKGVSSVDDARKYFLEHTTLHDADGIHIREIALPNKKGDRTFFWVGNRAFHSLEDARKSIAHVRQAIEQQGGSFDAAVAKVQEVSKERFPEEVRPEASRLEREEEFAIKTLDWLGFTQSLYGPLYGEPYGEPILYQSTFEGSYRTTNLDEDHFDAYTAFWSHRIVFKGIRFLGGTTIDPYLTAVPSAQTEGSDFATNLELRAGLEWRPLVRNAFLQNYQPYGQPVLDWLRNLAIFIEYDQRKNLKGKFSDADHTYNVKAGAQLFKEWGIDLPSFDQFVGDDPYFKKVDLLWGEYFAEWIFDKTNFTSGDNLNMFSTTNAFKFGLKFPRFPLPDNPVNQEFMLMPYFTFEDVRNSEFSRFFQNRYFYGWGLRWMPFRDYRFMNSEWLFKCKLFFEYMQDVHYTKAKPSSELPEKDMRLGINLSIRRF